MKTKITLLSAIGLLLGACTTGSYVTNGYDDIYYSPQNDVSVPVIAQQNTNEVPSLSNQTESSSTTAINNSQDNGNKSSVMENYIFQGGNSSSDTQHYNMKGMELVDSDTTALSNDSQTNYVINNYYDADDIDYTYRINRFHRFGFYDPFMWDSWNYDPFYYDPWAYNYYWPGNFSIGFGSYGWGFGFNYGWNSPYYSYYGGYPYYGGYSYYGGYNNWGNQYYNRDRNHPEYYGNHEYRQRGNRSSYSTISGSGSTHPQVRSVTDLSSVSGRKSISSSNGSNLTSQQGINNSTIYESRHINNTSSNVVKSNSSYTGKATSIPVDKNSSLRNTTSIRGVSSNSKSYTPSYTIPRTVTRSSYNTRSTTFSPTKNSSSIKDYPSVSTFNKGSVRSTENSSLKTYTPTVRSSVSSSSTRSVSSYGNSSKSSSSIRSSTSNSSSGSSNSTSHGGSPRR